MFLQRYQESSSYDKEKIKQYWCTEYAQERLNEIMGEIVKVSTDRDAGKFHNAQSWIKYSTFPTSDIPNLGSVACWSGGDYGHVAIVEDYSKTKNGYHISVTQANSKSTFFLGEYDVEIGKETKGVGVFQGFMNTPIKDIRVERDTTKNQVLVLAERLRVRETPKGKYTSGLGCPKGLYDVLEFKVVDDVLWAKIDDNSWIMTNDDDKWTETYYAKKSHDELLKELNGIIAQLDEEIVDMGKKIASQEATISLLENEVKTLTSKIENIKNIVK